MDRASFGTWGADLSDEEFAKALAIVGIQNAADRERSQSASDSPGATAERLAKTLKGARKPITCKYFLERPESWRFTHKFSAARDLAGVWDRLQDTIGSGPQFKIEFDDRTRHEPDRAGAGWIVDHLRNPAMNAHSVYLGEPPLARHIDWQWPIRIGILEEGTKAAYASATKSVTIASLTVAVDVLRERGTVDILWLIGNVSEALQTIENAPYAIHAHAVAITGGDTGLDWLSVQQGKERIAELTQAQAVIVVHAQPAAWLDSLIRELSHDRTLDVAVHRSGSDVLRVSSGPLLWSSDALIRGSKVSNFARNLVERGISRLDLNQDVNLGEHVARPLGLSSGPNQVGDVLERVGNEMQKIGWLHEYDGASVISGVNRAIRNAVLVKGRNLTEPGEFTRLLLSGKPPKFEPLPRHLQVAAFAKHIDGRQTKLKSAFAAGFPHVLEVHIGPARADRLVLEEPVPEHELPPSDTGGHLLSVVFFEPQCMNQPQLKTLFLPAAGPSLPCAFEFRVEDDVTELEGRITVLYENRVLQTGVVRGAVKHTTARELLESEPGKETEPGEEAELAGRIEFVLSGAVRRAIADLGQRSRFDAAIVLNHVGERPGMQGFAGNQTANIWLDDLTIAGAKQAIEKALDTGDWDYPQYNGLHADGTTELLRLLAFKGNDMFVALKKNFPAPIINAERLQVVMAKKGARFPVEFIYDFHPPAEDAPVCEHAAEALRTGSCAQDCKARKELPAPVVCPLGFWGLSRVLEWHAFSEEEASKLHANVPTRLDIDRAPRTNEVGLGGPTLFGYSKQIDTADKDCIPNFKKRIQKLPAPVFVESWTDWRDRVQELDPSVLMLLVHTEKGKYDTKLEMGPPSAAEIGKQSLLGTSAITREYVFGPHVSGSPIILLLGCTTASAKLSFETVASAFENRADAGIIVATSNLIYGPKAVEVAELFLRKLLEVQEGQTFGDVMLAVRRSALADGIAMILCISAYGDADWKLIKRA